MTGNGSDTKTRIMDAAERLILERGLGGTTVDAMVEAADITKGTFFYHFDTKDDLARSLVERYESHDEDLMNRFMKEAEERADDPLEQILLFIRRFEDRMEELTEPFPGCLFASYCYQNQLFDDEAATVVEEGLLRWRRTLGDKFRSAVEAREPRREVDPEALADMLTVIFEGSFILSKTLAEPDAVARQLAQYRTFLELLFAAEAT
jgi:TetR/AcrR family transcriptional repressor of nem operon